MRRILVLCLLAFSLHAQDSDRRVQWLADHAVRLRSIAPDDVDFKDLEPLRTTLKGVRVVLLGEQSHGDGNTFLAKTRLIRFLHEQMGFDVLVFESGLYDCAKAWDLRDPSRGIFRIWSASKEVQPLLDYLGARAKSERPLELAGTDCQLTGPASKEFLVQDLAAFLNRIDPKLAQGTEWDRVVRVIGHLLEGSWELETEPVPSLKEQTSFVQTIERWRSLIASHDKSPATRPWSGAYWRQLLASLRVFAEQNWRTDNKDLRGNPEVFAMRDRQMGKNLVWLAKERYPNRKLIVWAATFHNARALGSIETGDPKLDRLYDGNMPMGEVAWKELGGKVYSLGFASYEGEFGTRFAKEATPIVRPSRDSLEDLFARAGLTNAFVDFRRPPRWLRTPIVARLLGYTEMRADWTRVVDGVVFLRTMQRSHKP